MIPEPPGGRFSLYLGTGGPGHIDPYANDGVSESSQGIREDPSWQAPLYRLFDRIVDDESAALLAVCHTFGVMCHWSGLARPVLRGPEKGGKSTGVLENVLDAGGVRAPLVPPLRRGARRRRPAAHPRQPPLRPDPAPRAAADRRHCRSAGRRSASAARPGDAITMMEFARDAGGAMPRVFGVNHHPEIVDRARQLLILRQKLERGEVNAQWVNERREALTSGYPDEDSEHRLRLTSDYTLLKPLSFHLQRQMRLRTESLGFAVGPREDMVERA